MFLAPPIGTMEMPSASRSRPRRWAIASSAAWSLVPSTSTTLRGTTPAASWDCCLSFTLPSLAARPETMSEWR